MSHTEFYNNQIDFISLKVNFTDSTLIKMENLKEHPTLKNQYMLDSRFGEHAKNFSLYFQKEQYAILKLSVPYFLYGHNHIGLLEEELQHFSDRIKEVLNIDILEAEILEFEYGAFEQTDTDAKKYIKNILGLKNWNLEYTKPYMKMFGNPNNTIHYKIYDAVANAKQKGTYIKGTFSIDNVIKHEIKFTHPKKYFGKHLFFKDLLIDDNSDYEDFLIDNCTILLDELRVSLIEQNEYEYFPVKSDLTHVLYTALKNTEQTGSQNTTVYRQLLQLIGVMDLSSSQRSKRKKSIDLLEELYNPTAF